MTDSAHVIAGRCTTVFEGTREQCGCATTKRTGLAREQEQHGDMLVFVKPDNTVLVHDAEGYQPVAWLTRPESVTVTGDTVAARDGEQSLRVTVHDAHTRGTYPLGDAGVPVGDCPDCGGSVVRSNGTLSCPDCATRHPIPSNAAVLDENCGACGLPKVRVRRGRSFVLCPDCDSLTERVRSAFDREWECPDCGGELRVLYRGGLLLGCDEYPDCETAYAFPGGSHEGACECGLPVFETATGRRCLDTNCESAVSEGGAD